MGQDKNTIVTLIIQVVWAYHARGFHICNILGDGGFKCIRNYLSEMGITLNFTSRNEHVPEVERYIRKVKDGVQAIANSLPFKQDHHGLLQRWCTVLYFG